MTYTVHEIFYTLQGEGANTGRPAVFCRFAGCNLWTGRESDRSTAVCKFCDTDFVGGESFKTPEALVSAVVSHWPSAGRPFVVCTGGEPLLQLDSPLVTAFHNANCEIAIETNGTRLPPDGIDWICVSPKANAALVLAAGDELKLVYPQEGAEPERYSSLPFDNFFLQPMDGPEKEANTRAAIAYCLEHPQWRLSMQTHKVLGLR